MHNESLLLTGRDDRKDAIDLLTIRKRAADKLMRISEDGSLLEQKIDMIRKTTKHLKDKLAEERKELESAKWKLPVAHPSTYSLYPQTLLPTYSSYSSFPNYPRLPPYYYPQAGEFGYQYMMFGQMAPMLPSQRPLNALSSYPVVPQASACIAAMNVPSGMYTHLTEVDRLCEEEFMRMQKQINSLKKLRKCWGEHSSNDSSTSYCRRHKLRKRRNRH